MAGVLHDQAQIEIPGQVDGELDMSGGAGVDDVLEEMSVVGARTWEEEERVAWLVLTSGYPPRVQ